MKRFFLILAVAVLTIGSATAQKKGVAALTAEVEALKQQNGALSNEVDALKQQNAELQQQINDAKAREKKLQEENSAIKGEVKALTTQVNVLTESFKKLAGESSEAIATVLAAPANNTTNNSVAASRGVKYQIAGEPSCGMTLVREGLLYGFINSRNEYVIKAQYENVTTNGFDSGFHRGFAMVKKNGKWGVIDTTGKVVIPCSYDDVSVQGGTGYRIWKVLNGTKLGLVSAVNGAVVVPVKYDYIGDLCYGRIKMGINGKYGYLDKNGNVVIPARYDRAYDFESDGTANVRVKGNGWHYIDLNGNFVRND